MSNFVQVSCSCCQPSDSIQPTTIENPIIGFRTSSLPNAPVLLSPVNGSNIEDTTPEFSWSESIGASSYTLQLDNNSSFSSPTMMTVDEIQGTSFTITTELQHGRWFWRVRAANVSGFGEYSEIWEFAVIPSRTAITDNTFATVFIVVAAIVSVIGLVFTIVRTYRKNLHLPHPKVATQLISPRNATILVVAVGVIAPYAILYQTFTDPITSDLYQTVNLVAVFWQFLATADASHLEIISGFEMAFSIVVLIFHLIFALSINEYLRRKSTVLRVFIFWIVSQIPVLALSLPRYLTGSYPGSVFYIGPTFIALITGLILMKLVPHDKKDSWTESDQ